MRALASTPGTPLPPLTSDLHGCRSLASNPGSMLLGISPLDEMNTLREIWETYPVVQAIVQCLVATLWLWAGVDELRKGRRGSSIFWLFISAFMLVMIIVDHARSGHWGAALIGVTVAAAESWHVLKRWRSSESRA